MASKGGARRRKPQRAAKLATVKPAKKHEAPLPQALPPLGAAALVFVAAGAVLVLEILATRAITYRSVISPPPPAVSAADSLRSGARRRSIQLPTVFAVPDREVWKRGYEAEAARSLLEVAATLEQALELMTRFANPALDGSARGAWDPSAETWR